MSNEIARQWVDLSAEEQGKLSYDTFHIFLFGIKKIEENLFKKGDGGWTCSLFASDPIRTEPNFLARHVLKVSVDVADKLVLNGGRMYEAVGALLDDVRLGFATELAESGGTSFNLDQIQMYMLALHDIAIDAVKEKLKITD